MEIRKKDYSRVFEMVIAELRMMGYEGMVNHLKQYPPKKLRGTMYSSELVSSLLDAKENAGPELGGLKLSELTSFDNYANVKRMLEHSERGNWFNELKAAPTNPNLDPPGGGEMGGGGAGARQQVVVINETALGDWGEGDPDDDNECVCDMCDEYPIWKNPDTQEQLCPTHFEERVEQVGGSHGFQPWDCEDDEYREYVDDVGIRQQVRK